MATETLTAPPPSAPADKPAAPAAPAPAAPAAPAAGAPPPAAAASRVRKPAPKATVPTNIEGPNDSIDKMRASLRKTLHVAEPPPPEVLDQQDAEEGKEPPKDAPGSASPLPAPQPAAAPAVDPKPAAAPAVDPDAPIIPKGLKGDQEKAFAKMSKDLGEYRGQVKRLEGELKVAREAKPPAPTGDLALVTSQRDEAVRERDGMKKELAAAKLERTPEFRHNYVQPIAAAEKQIADIAAANGLSASDALTLADITDVRERHKQLKALVSELDPMDQVDMRTSIDVLANKRAESTRVLAESERVYEAVEKGRRDADSARTAEAMEKFKSEADLAFRKVFKQLQDPANGASLFRPVPGNDAWNAQLATFENLAIQIDQNKDLMANHEARADLILKAIGYEIGIKSLKTYRETVDKKMADLEARNKELEDRLAEVTDLPSSDGGTPPGEAPPEEDPKEGFATRIARKVEERTRGMKKG